MTKTFQKEIVVFILLSMYQCSDTRVSRNRNFRKVRIAPPTIVPTPSTTVPTPPTTVPTTGCWHNGVLHQPGSSFGGGYDAASNWCYGSYCDNDGNVINWDNFHCHPTTTPSTTTPPTTTTTTMPPQLGHHDGVLGNGPYHDPNCAAGRDSITHLFEWKWTDIKQECERFLGPRGYCGVQVSPANENAVVKSPNRPWWERYQPVSYNLVTRSGNEQEFKDMVNACNKNGVRIYVDVVINHMTGGYSGTGTGGSHFDGGSCSYPSVPYGSSDCNGAESCQTNDGTIHDYGDPKQVRNCKLVGLEDLKLGKDYVRSQIAGYLNKLLDMGVAGFRVDAAKHMWPGDLANVFSRLHNLQSGTFGSGKKPFIFQEVIDMGGEPIRMAEYFGTGRVTNFIYGAKLADIFLRNSNPAKYLNSWGSAWGMPSTEDVVVFLSNHDNQRGHGGGGAPLTFFDSKQMKIGTAFMLAHPYGFPRIMSSYSWTRNFQNGDDHNNWMGPPHNGDMSTKDVIIHADNSCGNGWVCEHRWRQVYNMVAFRNVVAGTTVQNWFSSGDYQIAFSRGNKGFIAIVADHSNMNQNIPTGLPSGTYCDVISGEYENGQCTGKSVQVGGDGHAHFRIDGNSDDPVVAIHIGAKVGSPKKVTT